MTPVPQLQEQEKDGSGNERPSEGQDEQAGGQDRLGALKDRDAVSTEGEEKKDNEKELEARAVGNAKEKEVDRKDEITPEIRIRLGRLDKLEPKYQGLLLYRHLYLFSAFLTYVQSF